MIHSKFTFFLRIYIQISQDQILPIQPLVIDFQPDSRISKLKHLSTTPFGSKCFPGNGPNNATGIIADRLSGPNLFAAGSSVRPRCAGKYRIIPDSPLQGLEQRLHIKASSVMDDKAGISCQGRHSHEKGRRDQEFIQFGLPAGKIIKGQEPRPPEVGRIDPARTAIPIIDATQCHALHAGVHVATIEFDEPAGGRYREFIFRQIEQTGICQVHRVHPAQQTGAGLFQAE